MSPGEKPRAFVLMPFTDELTAIYRTAVRPLLESVGYEVRRADDLGNQQSIIKDIVESIEAANLIIADLTGKNPNVMYEVGVAHARSRPTVLLTESIDDIPFDLRAYRAIRYDPSKIDLGELRSAAAGLLSGGVRFGNPVTDFVDVKVAPPASPERIKELQDSARSAGLSLIEEMDRFFRREMELPDSVGPTLDGARRGDSTSVSRLDAVLRDYARAQMIDVASFRRHSDGYYQTVRELIEGSDLRRAENADSARRLMGSVRDTRQRLSKVVGALRGRRDQLLDLAREVPSVVDAASAARVAYDETLAAVAISDASAQTLIDVIGQRLARVGA